MSVLARLSASGMTTDTYDKASEQLTPRVLSAPGFVAHVAFVVDGEFHVSETVSYTHLDVYKRQSSSRAERTRDLPPGEYATRRSGRDQSPPG